MRNAVGVSRAAIAGPDRGALLTIRQVRYNKELSRSGIKDLVIQRLESGRKGRDAEQRVRANGAICRPSDSIF